jgi:Zn-dependent protease
MMPLLLAVLLYKFQFKLGGALFGVLFVSVLLHEIGHILAARATDGSGDEILMWPLGGLAFVETSTPKSQAITAAGGPLVNLLLCGLFLPAVLKSGAVAGAMNPLGIPFGADVFGKDLVSDLQVLAFWFNWLCVLVNLIPAYPLDGGQIVRALLISRMGTGMGTEVAIRIAYATAVLLAVVGLVFLDHVILLSLGFVIVVLALQESYQLQASESYDDSFMGYDFSQGYTSLERSEPAQKPKRRVGLLARWLARRRAGKQQRLQEQAQQTERQLDAILAKVHDQGLTSLTLAERRLLKRASNRYRSKDAGPE